MAEKIKNGIMGAAIGMIVTFSAIVLTTGSYKEKVDYNYRTIGLYGVQIAENENEITGIKHDIYGIKALLLEVRSDMKTLLHKND